MKKQSFLQGAMVLAAAGVISRALGAVYRIPLTRIIGDEGMGLYQMAYPVYTAVLTIATAGINVAISKLVAEHLARGRPGEAYRTFRVSFFLMASLGLVFSVLMLLGARTIAVRVAHNPQAFYPIAALAPAILIVSLESSLRGFFQGQQIMTPTALSQVVEQLVRVAAVLLAAYHLLPRGIALAAGGATFGAAVGALAGLAVLLWIYWSRCRQPAAFLPTRATPTQPVRDIVAGILRLAIPVSLAGIVVPLMNMVDLVVVPARLIGTGYTAEQATRLYGQLTGMALTLVNLPTVLTAALQASLVPSVSESHAMGDLKAIRARAQAAIRITLMMALPAVAGLYLLATPIAELLFAVPEAGIPIAAMSGGLLFLALQQTTTGVLQGMGRTDLPVRNLLLGALVKLLASWVLTGVPALGIRGAALGTALGFLVAATLNVTGVRALTGTSIPWLDGVLRPAAATAAMAVAAVGGHRYLLTLLGGNAVATVLAIGLGMATYGLALLFLGALRERDLELIPGAGPAVARWLRSVGALRR